VMIDPREPTLAAAVAGVHARALAEAEPIAAALIAQAAELERAGFAPPVHVRPGAPLSFFHPGGPRGPRFRLDPAPGGGFAEVGGATIHSRAALFAELAADPMRFSTSALLRPIVQDALLPTAAYVGGPAEVAYFAQLPPLYRAFDRALPLVVPRARFRIVDERARRLLERLGLGAADAERPEAELRRERFDLRETLARHVAAGRAQAERAGLSLVLEDGPALELSADRLRIEQVVANLLDNALKYTERGGVTIAVGGDAAHAWGEIRDGHTWTCWRDTLDPYLTDLLVRVWG